MNAARTRKSFWLTAEDMAALMAMAGGEGKSASEKLRDVIRAAWQGWPAGEVLGAIPTTEIAAEAEGERP